MTGLARPNAPLVWADPAGYQHELAAAVDILASAGIATRIYNHQLCVLDRRLWPYAVRSISDWKNDYLDICRTCTVRDAAAASSPQAATASASTCAQCPEQLAGAGRRTGNATTSTGSRESRSLAMLGNPTGVRRRR